MEQYWTAEDEEMARRRSAGKKQVTSFGQAAPPRLTPPPRAARAVPAPALQPWLLAGTSSRASNSALRTSCGGHELELGLACRQPRASCRPRPAPCPRRRPRGRHRVRSYCPRTNHAAAMRNLVAPAPRRFRTRTAWPGARAPGYPCRRVGVAVPRRDEFEHQSSRCRRDWALPWPGGGPRSPPTLAVERGLSPMASRRARHRAEGPRLRRCLPRCRQGLHAATGAAGQLRCQTRVRTPPILRPEAADDDARCEVYGSGDLPLDVEVVAAGEEPTRFRAWQPA